MVREYLAWFRDVKRAKPVSLHGYAATLDKFLVHVGTVRLEDVPLLSFNTFVNRPRQGRAHGARGADATIARDIAVLKALYEYLHAVRRIDRRPTDVLVAPTVHNEMPRAVDDERWLQLWTSKLADDARVVLGLGYFLGLRRHEMVLLAPSHVHLSAGRLIGFQRKGGGQGNLDYAEMLGILADFLPHVFGPDGPASFLLPFEELTRQRRGRETLLPWTERAPSLTQQTKHGYAATGVDPQILGKRMQTWLRRAGLAPTAFTPHSLRHSCATNMLRAGVPIELVRELLNHSHLRTTQRYVMAGGGRLNEWRRSARAEMARLNLAEYPRLA